MQNERVAESRIIKRYPNRKLYDTRDSRYVTLRQVAKLVQDGEDVRIIDNKTKEDLTGATLAQILYEQERNADDTRSRNLPLHALRDLIGGGERLIATLRETSVGKLIARRAPPEGTPPEAEPETTAEKEKDPEHGVGPGRVKELVVQSREAFDELQRRLDERIRAAIGSFAPFVQMQGELRKLNQRLEEMERRLVHLARRDRKDDNQKDG